MSSPVLQGLRRVWRARARASNQPRRSTKGSARPQLEPLEERTLLSARAIHLEGSGASTRDFNRPGQVLVGPATVTLDGQAMSMLSIATVLESRVLPDGTIFGRVTHTFIFDDDANGEFDADDTTLTTLDHSRLVPTGTPGFAQFRPSRVITAGTGIFAGAHGRLGTIPGLVNQIDLNNQAATWSLRGAIIVPGPASPAPGPQQTNPAGMTLTVTTTADSGAGSLRQALLDSNASVGLLDTITFAIGNGAQTIQPLSPLPDVTDPVVIDAASQPGFAGSPLIELDGSLAGAGASGLRLLAGNSTVRGLVINRFSQDGIAIETNGFNVIAGNFLGTDATGATDLGNGRNGVFIHDSPGNMIGGITTAAHNVISGNDGAGVEIVGQAATANQVQGNAIGTNRGGNADLGNAYDGIVIGAAPGNTVGGADPRAGNIIAGNDASGIIIIGPLATGNRVQSNFIGTDFNAAADLGNALDGVALPDAPNNLIGGTQFGDFGQSVVRNIISGNNASGVMIAGTAATGNQVQGNLIGTDFNGRADLGNGFDAVLIDRAPGNSIGGTTTNMFGQNVARNVMSGNDYFGVTIVDPPATGNRLEGNFIGTDVDGEGALPNRFEGVLINNGVGNFVGGLTVNEFNTNLSRNLISGNRGNGVHINGAQARNNRLEGNFIGTDVVAADPIGNTLNGVFIQDAPDNLIGGTTFAARNVISGNLNSGINITGGTATGNQVQGNVIGTDAFGSGDLGNRGRGVEIIRAFSNTIGGLEFTMRNIISGNEGNGVEMAQGSSTNNVLGNFIGTDITGTTPLPNSSEGVIVGGGGANFIGGSRPGSGNVISGNLGNGLLISFGATATIVQGNLIGTDATGTVDLGNGENGVVITGANGNFIGGPVFGAGNTISGNGANGLIFFAGAMGNRLEGNFIGTDVTGTMDLGNDGEGILVNNSPANIIGGTIVGSGNVISGNEASGLVLFGPGATGTVIQGNFIGTNRTGSGPVGNATHGLFLTAVAANNTIGGSVPGAGNTIAYNGGAGVTSTFGNGNGVRANAIFSNAGLPIDWGADGATPNDPNDGDTGADALQNFPVVVSATQAVGQAGTTIKGRLNSVPNSAFTLDLFANPAADASGRGEGRTFLTSTTVTTDGLGNASFTVSVGATLPLGQSVTATATDPAQNTSEFSPGTLVRTTFESFVGQLYRDLLQREVDAAGLVHWTSQLELGASRAQIIASIQASPEYHRVLVEGIYNRFLHRSADPSGLSFFTAMLAAGTTLDQVESIIIGSDEYFARRSGATIDNFLNALYQDVLGRVPDAAGAAMFNFQLQQGSSRTLVAAQVLASDEADRILVRNLYDQYLGRPVDDAGLGFFAGALQRGDRDEQVIQRILASDEYFARL